MFPLNLNRVKDDKGIESQADETVLISLHSGTASLNPDWNALRHRTCNTDTRLVQRMIQLNNGTLWYTRHHLC